MKTQIPLPQDITMQSLAQVFSVDRQQSPIVGYRIDITQSPSMGPWKAKVFSVGNWTFINLTPSPDGRSLTVSSRAIRNGLILFGDGLTNQLLFLAFAVGGFIGTVASAVQGQFGASALLLLLTIAVVAMIFWMRKADSAKSTRDMTSFTNIIFELCRQLQTPTSPASPQPDVSQQPLGGAI